MDLFRLLGHLPDTVVKSVLKACVSVASLLAFQCGELLPCQASLLYMDGQEIHPVKRVLGVPGASAPRTLSVPLIKKMWAQSASCTAFNNLQSYFTFETGSHVAY